VLIEKYITRPRHIEIQVFGDTHGNVVHLFERDCSVQRRHQKVLEEAPAPGMTSERRAAMGRAAVEAAKAVGYVGAGTVEFIVNQDGTFYFMEMNTRLQVEHPVTEMITGQDLVEWQLRVAFGEPLPLAQEQLMIRGHSLEARIYAEDPFKGFLPSIGQLLHLAPPKESLHVRVDTGVEQGDEISPHYDPMIAKLIVWDSDRERALARMLQALADYRVVGVANNIEFLSRLTACPAFASADLDTGLIEREHAFLFAQQEPAPTDVWQVAALGELLRERQCSQQRAQRSPDPRSPWNITDSWRMNSIAQRELQFELGDQHKAVYVSYTGEHHRLEIDGCGALAFGAMDSRGALRFTLDGNVRQATVIATQDKRYVFLDGRTWSLTYRDPLHYLVEGDSAQGGLIAPMSGKVIALLSAEGQKVEQGAPLLILEAMKMEHTITAPTSGILRAYRFAVGDQVADGVQLVDLDSEEVTVT
jgi:3-methylcrotonyl-CoA carboxylase alpha subunit